MTRIVLVRDSKGRFFTMKIRERKPETQKKRTLCIRCANANWTLIGHSCGK